MPRRRPISSEDHLILSAAVLAQLNFWEAWAKQFAERNGATDTMTDMAVQAHKAVNRMRGELHRRFVLAGGHGTQQFSPYYPNARADDGRESGESG